MPETVCHDRPVSAPRVAAAEWRGPMLETIIVILIILWLLGYFAFNVGNLIHILLVIAIIVILIRVIQGRRPI